MGVDSCTTQMLDLSGRDLVTIHPLRIVGKFCVESIMKETLRKGIEIVNFNL